MINSTWRIVNLKCRPYFDQRHNVVVEVLYECRITDDDYPEIVVTHSDWTSVQPPGYEFTEFEELQEAQVIEWVHQMLGEIAPALETELRKQFIEKCKPIIEIHNPPWTNVGANQ